MVKAFRKGINDLRARDIPSVRKEIRECLGLSESSRALLARYIDGKMTLDVEKYEQISEIFRHYGVNNPWGDE